MDEKFGPLGKKDKKTSDTVIRTAGYALYDHKRNEKSFGRVESRTS
jgi:hypothetical protein